MLGCFSARIPTHPRASFILVTALMPTLKSKIPNTTVSVVSGNGSSPERERVFSAFRQWGYLEGDLDPLGFLRPRKTPELQIESEYAHAARSIYASTIGVEINHIYGPGPRQCILGQMASEAARRG